MPSVQRILVAHNAYQHRGGEDAVFETEVELLRTHGHEVKIYTRHNDELATMSRVRAAREAVWSTQTTADVARLVQAFRPDVIHVHNTFPLISPSLYWAASRAGVPVVQTLHNFRIHCPQAMYLREGRICQDCVGRIPLPAIAHACYRGSRLQSAVLTTSIATHRALGTLKHKVRRFIALNEFCKKQFVAGGLPEDKISVKANFVDVKSPPTYERKGFLFVGRLAPEKGISVLAAAAADCGRANVAVAGSGPEEGMLAGLNGIELLGALQPDAILDRMARAVALLMPSIWYENFPRTLVEAFACGLPVIASRIGALAELVEHGVTGLLFSPGDGEALAEQIRWANDHPHEMREMGANARRRYEALYTARQNYSQLINIYRKAMGAEDVLVER